MKTVKYIFFDIGYTLVNEDNVWIQRCKEQAETQQALDLQITADTLMQDVKTASLQFKSQWKSVIAKYGFTQSAKYKSELETLYADTRLVLEKLSKKFKLGIIANQSGDLLERLRGWNIDKYFSTVVSSADYGISKPDERLFNIALEKSGCPAHSAVMVGDRLDNDILPANKLGFQTVRIKQGFAKDQIAPSTFYQPTYEVNNLTELLELPFVLS
ncbi:MAG: HAD family hydrolase [Clostridiales bacterium]|nr:HAD family hydrolase [Clostridiales bacterium]